MGNPIFSALLDEKIETFKSAFVRTAKAVFFDEKTRKLIHPGEFGTYREAIVRDFLRFFVPRRLAIQSGFLITPKGDVSTQCDIVIFDAENTPLIESSERQRFFPVETVCCIGEIKSDVTKQELKAALNKLAKNESLRDAIHTPTIVHRDRSLTDAFDPRGCAYDQIPSFLICNKLSFGLPNIAQEISSMYEPNIEVRHRHNLILSVQDGVALYCDANRKSMMYPEIRSVPLKTRFVIPNQDSLVHFHLFCAYLFLIASSATILYPDIASYMPVLAGGHNHDG